MVIYEFGYKLPPTKKNMSVFVNITTPPPPQPQHRKKKHFVLTHFRFTLFNNQLINLFYSHTTHKDYRTIYHMRASPEYR